jgi:hypothetical protein
MFISIFSGGAHVLSSVYNHLLLSNLTFEAIWKAWSASSTSSAAAGREATSHSCLVSQPFNGAFSFFFLDGGNFEYLYIRVQLSRAFRVTGSVDNTDLIIPYYTFRCVYSWAKEQSEVYPVHREHSLQGSRKFY